MKAFLGALAFLVSASCTVEGGAWEELATIPFNPVFETNHVCVCGVTNHISKTNQYQFVLKVTNPPVFTFDSTFETSTDLQKWEPIQLQFALPANDEKRFFRVKPQ